MPEIHNPSGTLSVYGFACGYIEETDGPIHGVRLWQDGCYHVRRHHTAAGKGGYIQESWHAFDSLTEARRWYTKEVKRVLKGDPTILPQEH